MRPRTRKEFTIAIICALPLEAEAVEALFDEHYDRLGKYYGVQQGDANAYVNGRIGKHNVVVCYMRRMGKESAAVASSLLVSYTGIELALVVGICGGGPPPPRYEEIFLGDVIISDSVLQYDFGKQYPGGFQRQTGHIQDTFGRPVRRIRTLLNGLRAENTRREFQEQTQQYLQTLQQTGKRWQHPRVTDILFESSYVHKHYSPRSVPTGCSCLNNRSNDEICDVALGQSCDELICDKGRAIRCRKVSEATRPSIYIGTVASADTVMKSGQHRDEIVRKEQVIGFEMEGSGVWDNVPCIIIKGVCDYADSHKNKLWQAYAAATGASATKAFLEYWMPTKQEDARTTRHLMVPFERNMRFVGRQSELDEVEDMMSHPDGPTKIAIAGLGGVGKTQIALELAYRMRDRELDCSIFWIPCTSYEAVEQACLTIAEMLGIQVAKPTEVKQQLKTYFQQASTKWLLIFDNADDTDMWTNGTDNNPPLRDYIPSSKQGHVLFTTRNRELAVDLVSSDIVDVRQLDEKSGVEFLKKSLLSDLPNDHQTMIELLEQLEFLPLAISQATAYINKKGITVSDYLVLLQEQETDVVELLSKDFMDERRYKDAQNPVAKTWLVSFSQIEKLNGLAAEYLQFMACVNPRDIPQSLLPPKSKLQMADALGLLSAYSLITTNPGNKDITLHRLVHLATRNWLRRENRYALYITKIADRLNEIFPDNDHTNRRLWRSYLPHALFLLDDGEFREQQEQYTHYMQNLGTCLDSDAKYVQAEQLFAQVVKVRERLLGPKHLDTLDTMNYLVVSYMNQRKWEEAEELGVRVIEARQVILGPDHPDTLISMANLASTYANRERWQDAAILGAQVMMTRQQVLGSDHPDTLTSMANLATIYQLQKRWKEAEALAIEVVAARKQVLGPEHPDTINCMAILASVYRDQERYREAEEVGLQVVRAWREILGPEHPLTLIGIENLASVYYHQGRWKEAEELEAQAVELQRELLGQDHPSTLTSLGKLSSIFSKQGRLAEAEALGAQVAKTQEQLFGPEHPVTLKTWSNLLPNYQAQTRWNEAAELGVRILRAQKQVLGPRHPDSIHTMCILGVTYQHLEKWTEAEELERTVFEYRKAELGLESPHTLDSMAMLAYIYQDRQRWTEAEELGLQLVEGRRQMLGTEHPTTLLSMYSLAFSLKYLGKTSEALALMRKCADLRVKVLGSDHPDTESTFRMLTYWETDMTGPSEQLHRPASKKPFERFFKNSKPVAVHKRGGIIALFRGP